MQLPAVARSKYKSFRLRRIAQRRDAGLEQRDRIVRAAARARRQACLHRGRYADDCAEAAARLEALLEFVGQHRHRARQHDDVVGRVFAPAARRIADFQNELMASDIWTLRRIIPAERGQDWDQS